MKKKPKRKRKNAKIKKSVNLLKKIYLQMKQSNFKKILKMFQKNLTISILMIIS